MPDRRDMDRPAIAIAAVTGVVFMGVFGTLASLRYCDSPDASCTTAPAGSALTFNVAWAQVPASQASIPAAGIGASKASTAAATAAFAVAHVTIAAGACKDSYNPQIQQQPAKFTWK